jgi:hypothetical protein
LGDKDEVKLQAHQLVIKLCVTVPAILSSAVDTLIEPLEKTVTKKNKELVGLEAERALEVIRSASSVITSISALPDIETNRNWQDFMDRLTRAGIKLTE